MPTESHIEGTTKDDGTQAEKLVVEFSNGSLQQLRELAAAFDIEDDDPYKALELAIGLLESIKDKAQDSKQDKSKI